MNVYWTDTAVSHLFGIYGYIAQNSLMYAKRMVDKLTRRSEQISMFPMSGRKVPEYELENIREIIEKPYRIIYRIRKDRVDILAVMHGAQLLPENANFT